MANGDWRPRPLLYLAAPLFSCAELEFNVRVREIIAPWFRVYLPQEDGILLNERVRAGASVIDTARRIFDTDVAVIRDCDVVLALLDGRAVDEGVAFEIGYAVALGKSCVGVQTDPRRLLPYGNNPMIACSLDRVLETLRAVENWAAEFHSVWSSRRPPSPGTSG